MARFFRSRSLLWAAALAGAAARSACCFSLDSIERWSGTGTNRSAFVVDWHDGTRPHALAWGFRWNGSATVLDLWCAVTNSDSGLTGFASGAVGATNLYDLQYCRPGRDGDLLPGTGAHDVRWTAYTWDHTGDVCRTRAWSHWRCDGPALYAATNLTLSMTELGAQLLADGSWDAWSRDGDNGTRRPGLPAAALYYPFAAQVVAYASGTGTTYSDWISGDPFTDPTTALGRPTVDTTGDDWYIPLEEPVPVVPVYPAFRSYEMVTVGKNGSLTLAFDHRVYDNSSNPYGIDFIVFGNSFQVIGTGDGWSNGDPNSTKNGGSAFVEKGTVSVSQDGVSWFAYPSGTNCPGADDFAPTLGRVYDTNRVEHTLGDWNAWWGGPTDPTIPIDPALAPSNWVGMSVAEISDRYRGGAGGTGFDIGGFTLATDSANGLKWIQYVRVERSSSVNPEVDAVADVSPSLPYDLWRNACFSWMGGPTNETDSADPDSDGLPNLMEYGLGRNPTNSTEAKPFTVALRPPDAPDVLRFQYSVATNAPDAVVAMVLSDRLSASNGWANGVSLSAILSASSNGFQSATVNVAMTGHCGFVKMRVRHDE